MSLIFGHDRFEAVYETLAEKSRFRPMNYTYVNHDNVKCFHIPIGLKILNF